MVDSIARFEPKMLILLQMVEYTLLSTACSLSENRNFSNEIQVMILNAEYLSTSEQMEQV